MHFSAPSIVHDLRCTNWATVVLIVLLLSPYQNVEDMCFPLLLLILLKICFWLVYSCKILWFVLSSWDNMLEKSSFCSLSLLPYEKQRWYKIHRLFKPNSYLFVHPICSSWLVYLWNFLWSVLISCKRSSTMHWLR